ncbi:MAG: S26 family signal peptidase [Hyphomicrobiales bacterium]
MPGKGGEPRSWLAPFVRLAALAVAAVAAAAWIRRRFVTYEVAGESMFPSYHPGDFVVAQRLGPGAPPRVGDVVLVPDPRVPDRMLMKRVSSIDLHGQVYLLGDNYAASTDSRHFGLVDSGTIVARVVFRYWPLLR